MHSFVQTSRPRFWLYVLGPFLIGSAAGYVPSTIPSSSLVVLFFLAFLYFTFPANFFIYGVNDIFDYETDVRNAKKQGYETLVPPDKRHSVARALLIGNLPFLVTFLTLTLLFAQNPLTTCLSLSAFLFFSFFYSAPPIRAKTKPFLDALFNVLYLFPAVVGWSLFTSPSSSFSFIAFFGGTLWCMAMHAYSAIPDITADTRAGFSTVATVLGLRKTLLLCGVLFGASALIAHLFFPFIGLLLGIPYLWLILTSLRTKTEAGVRVIYQRFPLINTLLGAALFFLTLFL
jgi:lycopene elongase/hydratase (dihydrobisanhydrobacterioruberin-forming)